MGKRKSSTELRNVITAPGRRLSIANIRTRATNITRRKSDATNIRPTSSYKVIRSRAKDAHCDSARVPGTHKSNVIQKEITHVPKTRFNVTNDRHICTPRLKGFPVECVKKTVVSYSRAHSPPSLQDTFKGQDLGARIEKPLLHRNMNTRLSNVIGHGYGDASDLQLAGEPVKRSQEEGETKDRTTQSIATERCVSKINQSVGMLNNNVAAPATPSHCTFAPSAVNGMTVGDCSSQKSASFPRKFACQGSARSAARRVPEQVASTVNQQAQEPELPVRKQVSQIPPRENQPFCKAPVLHRDMISCKVHGSPFIPAHNIESTVGGYATAPHTAPVLETPSDEQRLTVTTQHPVNVRQNQFYPTDTRQWMLKQQQQAHEQSQQKLQLQQRSQQEAAAVRESQNPQRMYQQLQANIIHQRQVQQKAFSHQQQMARIAQQQMELQPFAHQPRISSQQPQSCGDHRNQQRYPGTQSPNSTTRTGIMYTRYGQLGKPNVPHYRILMHDRDTTYQLPQTIPQHGWVHNGEVTSDLTGQKSRSKPFAVDPVSPIDKEVPSNDVRTCDLLQHREASMMAHQQHEQEQPGVRWDSGPSYPPYQVATHQQYVPPNCIPYNKSRISCRHFSPLQQDGQDKFSSLRKSRIDDRHQTQRTEQSQQRQPKQRMMNRGSAPGARLLSQTSKNKSPEFTVEMIRDQELLVRNMRQQNIPENIMKRQFDALLDEQRRHIAYHDWQEVPAVKVTEIQPHEDSRTLREDQRPEWMVRLTPPRMTLQAVHNSTDIQRHRDVESCQVDSEQAMPKARSERDTIRQVSDRGSQDCKICPHQWDNRNRRDIYQSWQRQSDHPQYGTALAASRPYSDALFREATSGSQRNESQNVDPQCCSVRSDDFQLPLQQDQQQRPQLLQHQYQQRFTQQQPKLPYRHQVQPSQSMIYRNYTHQVVPLPLERNEHCDRTMPKQIEGERVSDSNIYPEQHYCNFKHNETTSLLKLKEFKEYVRPQSRFNGLQDAETVKAALEALKNPEDKKGWEYVAKLERNVTPLKLNGTQDPSELENLTAPPFEDLRRMEQQQRTRFSANGLCNTRNLNNPPSPPVCVSKNADYFPTFEYPRQYNSDEKLEANMAQCGKLVAEKDNCSVPCTVQNERNDKGSVGYGQATDQHSHLPMQVHGQVQHTPHLHWRINDRGQRTSLYSNGLNQVKPQKTVEIVPYRFDGSESQHHQQLVQFCRNRLNLGKLGKSSIAASPHWPGTWNGPDMSAQFSKTNDGQLQIQPDVMPALTQPQPNGSPTNESTTAEKMMTSLQQPPVLTHRPHNATEVPPNKDDVDPFLNTPQDPSDSNDYSGQPEIRVPKTIGGLTYLARKVDYIQNPSLLAPNILANSKGLQPAFA